MLFEVMDMKILAINGSPRGRESNTDRILLPFLKGTEKKGAITEVVYLNEQKVKSCLGCYHCWTTKPGECVIKDNMSDLLQKIISADTLVFATPLYFYTMSGIMKNFCDRLLPLLEPYFVPEDEYTVHPVRRKDCWKIVVISNAGFPDDNPFTGLIETFKHVAKVLGKNRKVDAFILRSFGELLTVPELQKRVEPFIKACELAGEEFIMKGHISEETEELLKKPLVSLERQQVVEMTNEFWKKAMNHTVEAT